MRPQRCPKCHTETALVVVARMSPRELLESCHICGHGLDVVARDQFVHPDDAPESSQAPADVADAPMVPDDGPRRLGASLELSGEDVWSLDAAHAGTLASDGPRVPMWQLLEDLAARTGKALGPRIVFDHVTGRVG